MKWIKGTELNQKQIEIVKSAFGYRWTHENLNRAKSWYRNLGLPEMQPESDTEWLASHAFQFTNNGLRLGTSHHCQPIYLVKDDLILKSERSKP